MTGPAYSAMWPILDRGLDHIAEARPDLEDMLAAEHLAPVGPTQWQYAGTDLTATVPIVREEPIDPDDRRPWNSRRAAVAELFDLLAA